MNKKTIEAIKNTELGRNTCSSKNVKELFAKLNDQILSLSDEQKKLLGQKDLIKWEELDEKCYVALKERMAILKKVGLKYEEIAKQ